MNPLPEKSAVGHQCAKETAVVFDYQAERHMRHKNNAILSRVYDRKGKVKQNFTQQSAPNILNELKCLALHRAIWWINL